MDYFLDATKFAKEFFFDVYEYEDLQKANKH